MKCKKCEIIIRKGEMCKECASGQTKKIQNIEAVRELLAAVISQAKRDLVNGGEYGSPIISSAKDYFWSKTFKDHLTLLDIDTRPKTMYLAVLKMLLTEMQQKTENLKYSNQHSLETKERLKIRYATFIKDFREEIKKVQERYV